MVKHLACIKSGKTFNVPLKILRILRWQYLEKAKVLQTEIWEVIKKKKKALAEENGDKIFWFNRRIETNGKHLRRRKHSEAATISVQKLYD